MRILFFHALLLLTFLVALRRGDRTENIAALVCAGGVLLTTFWRIWLDFSWSGLDHSTFVIDALMLAFFVYIALRTDRFWPLWSAGLMLVLTMGHLILFLGWPLTPQLYAITGAFWSYPVLVTVLIGAWRTPRYKRRLAEQA
ncbi:hypothetical protein [Sphingomicrobium marinum]|uniref:hypothetical protein n=1 Tax=Sphingomicrobium marinum TaxID=1227950 RepID=UPI00223F4257|nr:hypothetical protein [Sphingomicrobium marinum]